MVALGGTLAYISPGTLAYGENVFIPIQVCSRTHVYQKTLPEFLSVFPVRYKNEVAALPTATLSSTGA
jgi:hypothetical protein